MVDFCKSLELKEPSSCLWDVYGEAVGNSRLPSDLGEELIALEQFLLLFLWY